MTLYLIGIGLHDEKDITVKGLEAVRKCTKVYLETYTSSLSVQMSDLERFYQKKIIAADRDLVEKNAESTILKDAASYETAFLVIGDVFGATTHTDIRMRAHSLGIKVKVIHNASVMTAVGATGLELYKFGKTTSIPFNNENVKAPLEVFAANNKLGLHTLFLLDLDPPKGRYMRIGEAVDYLLSHGLSHDRMCVGCAGLGSDAPEISYMKSSKLALHNFTKLPQCLIIPGKLHFMEEEALEIFR